jgi:hypothetical protein
VACSCEHGNESSGTVKCWEILEELSNCWLLNKDSGPRSSLAILKCAILYSCMFEFNKTASFTDSHT